MSDAQAELLSTFRAFIKSAEQGAPIPPVEEHDLKALHELCIERAKRYCGKDGVISIEQTSRVCTPGANLAAVWLRHTQLRSLFRQGQLAEWQHGTTLKDEVFRLAASIPMSGAHLDHDDFLKRLRATKSVAKV